MYLRYFEDFWLENRVTVVWVAGLEVMTSQIINGWLTSLPVLSQFQRQFSFKSHRRGSIRSGKNRF